MNRYIILTLTFLLSFSYIFAQQSASSAKRERNFIKEGNTLYNDKKYAEAEIAYRKALQENEGSEIAMFNLASALLRQVSLASGMEDNAQNNPRQEASKILQNLAQTANNEYIAENALYDLGNIAFNDQQYQQSIEWYKKTLRKNPDNDNARENLRLAQLKLQEQQNQDQNQDKDKQDQQQDQENQDKQDKQDQQQDQQQEQNQDQDQEQQNQQQQDQQQQEQQDQQHNGISDRNAEQILKAMENQENATRRKVEAEKAKEEQAKSRYNTDKPW